MEMSLPPGFSTWRDLLRDIKDGDVLISAREKVVHERGFTTAHIDNRCRLPRSNLFCKAERLLKVRTIPADCVRGFLRVDSLPMTLRVHID